MNFHIQVDVKPAARLDEVVVGVKTREIQNVHRLNIGAVLGQTESGLLVVVVLVKDMATLEVAKVVEEAAEVRKEEPIPIIGN